MDSLDSQEEQNRLNRLAEYQILDTPEEPVFTDLAAFAADFCRTPMSVLTFLDKEREWFKSRIGVAVNQLPRHQALSAPAIEQRDVVVVPDAAHDARFADNPLVRGEPHVRCFAGCPLFSADGRPLGAICVLDSAPHGLTEEQQKRLRTLSADISRLLELRRENYINSQYNEEQKRQLDELRKQLDNQCAKHQAIEHELKQREQQLADAQRIARLGSWECDLVCDRVLWSRELYRILGHDFKPVKVTYDDFVGYVHPDDRPDTDAVVKKAIASNGSFLSEHRIIRSDGVIRIVLSKGEVICDEKQKPVRIVGCCQDITERREMEQHLENTVAALNATLEATADGILVVNRENKVSRWNHKFVEMWGLQALAKGSEHLRIIAPVMHQVKDPERFLQRLRSIYEHPDVDTFDVLEFKDGRTFERLSQPKRIGERIVGRVWSFRDTTARTLAHKVLRQSEERYRSLVIATTQVVWSATCEGLLLEDSPSWRKFTGQTLQEMLGTGWLNAIHPKDRTRVHETWSHAVTTREHYNTECRIRRTDGEWRDIFIRAVPVFEPDQTVREWVGFCIDVTEHKKAEQLVLQERDFSQALINSLPGIFYVLDETGLNLRWNKNVETISEYSAAEISRMTALDFVPAEEKKFVAERVHKVLVTGHADLELTLMSKSGKRIPFYCTGVLVTIARKPHIVGMGIDISELRRARDEVNQLNATLEKRVAERTIQLNATNKELESFTYTASHDLRSPIRAMVGFARAVQDDYGAQIAEEGRLYLEKIVQAGDRMLQLIDDLLEYSRIGRAALHIRPVDMREFFQQLHDDFKLQLKAIGGELRIAENIPDIVADPSLLRQVFSNLVQNAIAYRRKDRPLKIAITWAQEDHYAIIKVTDNGVGIDSKYFGKIFEIFHRLHRYNEYGGTGIGLANVKKAAETLGGTVTVESELGNGATFNVRLPMAV